ncbi:TnsA-like heteromeric transposase endonuclease subunit [Mycolicibacterium sp. ELW1]|uniref:TnsA-like heteromeric transposase endonuclease subunit n=1 Tax=Mycobacteriaceae TaxID=1762 RepID=UPI0025710EB8|nr:TnsA-like heteromeric transposase endonuclease subunit [Mycobacterium sp. ELW1]
MDVDVSSAVIAFRPAAGEERCLPAGRAPVAALLAASPWRTFRWYFGQRHYSGTYWSSRVGDHVIYESRLELSCLIRADFDPDVRAMVAQPFLLSADVGGRLRRHIPDYLWDTVDGPVVVDVVRRERLAHPDIETLCAWTNEVVGRLGWGYQVVSESEPVEFANIRFLAGYRRDWLVPSALSDAMRAAIPALTGGSIARAASNFQDFPRPIRHAALFNLLWRHELRADLGDPLSPSTVLEEP